MPKWIRCSIADNEFHMDSDGLKRAFVACVPVLLLLVLAAHTLATFAYLTPVNPVKLRISRWLYAYMHPVFQQDWRLFAPDPVKDTRTIEIKCRVLAADGRSFETGWTDITTPYWEAHYRNRASPAERIARSMINALRMSYTTDPEAILIQRKLQTNSRRHKDILKSLQAKENRNRAIGVRTLNRIASAHCGEFYGLDQVQAVRVRMVVRAPPPFSERDLPDAHGTVEHFDYDWSPRQHVAPLRSNHGRP